MSKNRSTERGSGCGIWGLFRFVLLGAILACIVIFGLPILRVVTGGTLFGVHFTDPPFRDAKKFSLLVLGLDEPDRINPDLPRRSDTILLANVDLTTKMVTGVSIPRDTRVRLDDGNWTKINSAYSEDGVEGTRQIVKEITGVRADYYVVVDTASTAKLVDMVGGVRIDVDKRMKYDDNWGQLHINLQPGIQMLNGKQATGYLRFRHDPTGDLARIKRQQMFVRAMARRLVSAGNLTRIGPITAELKKQVKTNIKDSDLAFLAYQFKEVPGTHFEFQSLEGGFKNVRGISYLTPDHEKMNQTIKWAFPDAQIPEDQPVDTL